MTARLFWKLSLFIPLVVFLAFGATHASPPSKPAPIASFPIKIVNNRVVLKVRMGDHQLFMALDTGTSSTAVFQSNDHNFSDLAIEESAEIVFPALDEIVSGARLVPVPFTLDDHHSYVPERLIRIDRRPPIGDRLNFRFNGIFGQDFFANYVVEVIRETFTLNLYPSNTNLQPFFGKSLKLHIDGNAPYIILKNQMPWEKEVLPKKMMLDTGYPGAMVIWGKEHFKLAARGDNPRLLQSENKGIFTNLNFRVGHIKFRRTPVFISPNEPVQAHLRDGIIGNNILIWLNHAIDFSGNRVLLDTGSIDFTTIDPELYVPDREDFYVKQFPPINQNMVRMIY